MIGSFLTRGLVMVFGYAYPAYECYKTVEKNKPEIEQLRFWCQYWILVACLTVFERVGDAFVSWVPMYSEAKLAFFIYLWYPKTRGTTYVYDSFFRPYVAKHENEIDRNLLELKTRAGDMVVIYWQRVASYVSTRIFEILQYVAAQSTPRPQPPQKQGLGAKQNKALQSTSKEPQLPVSSSSSESEDDEVAKKARLPKPETSTSEPASDSQDTQTIQKSISAPIPNPTQSIPPTKAEPVRIEKSVESPSEQKDNENSNSTPPKETIMKETIRVTRGRLRKTHSAESR
ncbi:PREDICTED: putative HVA22-like protein g [Tarenaya hassleriana]|uniref:putative HVA22-like protein g n=1 Tax=Tarenaya hassleriana TaxID=28532 RepID=UPI00053C2E86|nr:PREDICTED: putative HVA22-like protein g [Tarenaya hassleriana]